VLLNLSFRRQIPRECVSSGTLRAMMMEMLARVPAGGSVLGDMSQYYIGRPLSCQN
jgi:hypothetical protein